MKDKSQRRAFTLVEMLVVIGIVSVLDSILFPVFARARNAARTSACLSNLHQIGLGVAMYTADYDERYSWAVDPFIQLDASDWADFPAYQSAIPVLPMIQVALAPYTRSREVFHCPSGTGAPSLFPGSDEVTPFVTSSYSAFGTSYYYNSLLAAEQQTVESLPNPAQTATLFDGAGSWHGDLEVPLRRYNIVFADNHAKNLSRAEAAGVGVSHPIPGYP
ncbi:MAG: DUF1559 domain-containing protein [Armatimonadetes bacterium]|nr:DUF1559 domain-containing protein [Armatimonadota bacterium]MDE2207162.1 DUF1559 domain-containing protein [Armatimonadota bacterium]